METRNIIQRFNSIAKQYDSQRKCFIPCFEEYYTVGIKLLARERSFRSILDLGAGTGLLSQFLYRYFPRAAYTLVDISDDMLKVAQQRFAGLPRFRYINDDFSRHIPEGQYDLIVSALSIHHLTDNDKAKLYQRIYASLAGAGCFLNIDQYNSESGVLNKLYAKEWLAYIKESGLPEADIKKGMLRRKLDKETTIPRELAALRKTGFRECDCVYKYLKFGVVVAKK